MNCDRIAPFYRWLEMAAFGGRLQRHRVTFQHAAQGRRHVLVAGDGDGRFTAALAKTYPEIEIDFIEMSAGMVSQARKRFPDSAQIQVIQADLLDAFLPHGKYEILFTHFFLDCFSQDALQVVIQRLSAALTPRCVWIVSDFREVPTGWRKLFTKVWLATMYTFFRVATGLRTNQLPDYAPAMRDAGFHLHEERVSMAGLIASEWWQR